MRVFRLRLAGADVGCCEFVFWFGSALAIVCYGLVFRCLGCIV